MKNIRPPKISLTHVLFFLYCAFLVWCVLFKTAFTFSEIQEMTRPRSFNLIPFYYDEEISIRFHLWEVLMNAILFFPFGVYLKMLDTGTQKSILYGFFFSVAMELCQLTLALGACDITDLITNTLGTAAGVCLYLLIVRLFKNQMKVNKVFCILAFTATILLGLLLLMLFLTNY